ncbi:MAG: hypothetical protein KDA05_03795 [Phycisphaerales bacterium]|nr:hypothetical protein [Phycisphaerales bacterium]
MSTPNGTIKEHIDRWWNKHEEATRAVRSRRAEHRRVIAELERSSRQIQSDIANKLAVKKQASANGLDTTPLDGELARLQVDLDTVLSKQEDLRRVVDQEDPKPPFDEKKIGHFIEHVATLPTASVGSVQSIRSAESLLDIPPEGFQTDDAGRVVEAEVHFSSQHIGTVSVADESNRFAKAFRPAPLRWLPEAEDTTQHRANRLRQSEPLEFWIVEDSHSILIASEISFSRSEWSGAPARQVRITAQDAPFVIASSVLEEAIEAEGGEIRFDRVHQHPFLARIQELLVEQTLERSPWTVNMEWPDSGSVYASLKEDLQLIVAAPWSDDILGKWAKLKYTLENGERPRLWRKLHVGHYGLRLRTRDHSWLVGSIFVDSGSSLGKAGDPMAICHQDLCHVGRICMQLAEYRDQR